MGARVLVHKSVYNKFVAALTEKASRIRMGDPMDVSTQVSTLQRQYNCISYGRGVLCRWDLSFLTLLAAG